MTEEDLKQACEAAAGADVVVIFAGLPDSFESEGYDRTIHGTAKVSESPYRGCG